MLSKYSVQLCPANLEDVPDIFQLESASFPPDEAASQENIRMRVQQANAYFKIVRNREKSLHGFINGTCVGSEKLEHASMSTHEPSGKHLVLHSVTVTASERRKGLGRSMLSDYVMELIQFNDEIQSVLLLSKGYLVRFYSEVGFSMTGLSAVTHGQDPWFEMKFDLAKARRKMLQIDAFAAGPFSGNPAAVVFKHADDKWMQNLALENNLAETAFLSARREEANSFDLRWFTPATEVALCGHATLASAHAVYTTGRVAFGSRIDFHTLHSGILTAQGQPDGSIKLDFPSTCAVLYTPTDEEYALILSGLGLQSAAPIIFVGKTVFDIFIEIIPEAFLNLKSLNFQAIEKLGGRGVIVTCLGAKHTVAAAVAGAEAAPATHSGTVDDSSFDFLSRFFAPCCLINEDPVTGSAHCALTPHWAAKLGTRKMTGFQASARGGVVNVELSECGTRVSLLGNCITTITAEVLV